MSGGEDDELRLEMMQAMVRECMRKCYDKKTDDFHLEEAKCQETCVSKFIKTQRFVENFLKDLSAKNQQK